MKAKILTLIMLFAALALSACAQAGIIMPVVDASASSIERTEVKCIRDTEDTRLLIQGTQGYCLQYPAEYDLALPSESEIMLIKRSMVNVTEPRAHIIVQPAAGKTVEQVADQLVADYSVPGLEITRTALTIDGEQAVVLDGLGGQDVNRQLVVIHEGTLYHLSFLPMDKSQVETYSQAQALFDTVIRTFNFRPESNVCPDCPPSASADEGQAEIDPQSASISGWVWHDLCDSGKDGQPPPAISTLVGCVGEETALGPYHANGVQDLVDPSIEGVVVSLGEGECPSTGLAEMSTIVTDLSYYFTSLSAGTYCVSIDPQREPNFSILRPGIWTYPYISQDIISTTVTLGPGEYRGMVNFGWDYQFKP